MEKEIVDLAKETDRIGKTQGYLHCMADVAEGIILSGITGLLLSLGLMLASATGIW